MHNFIISGQNECGFVTRYIGCQTLTDAVYLAGQITRKTGKTEPCVSISDKKGKRISIQRILRVLNQNSDQNVEHLRSLCIIRVAVYNGFNDATAKCLSTMTLDEIRRYDESRFLVLTMLETADEAEKYLLTGEQTNDTEEYGFEIPPTVILDPLAVYVPDGVDPFAVPCDTAKAA